MKCLKNIYYLYANMDKNNKFLFAMILLIIFLLILIAIISYVSKVKENKMIMQKRKEYKKQFKKNVKPINFEEEIKENISLEEQKKEIEKVKVDSIKQKINVKEEPIETIEDENIEIIEVSDTDDEIDSIKKSIEENIGSTSIDLNKWEQEQEESAIISYDELVKRAGAKKIVYKTKKKEEKPSNSKGFRPSKIVSPVYGIQETNNDSIKKMDEEINSFSRIEKLKVKDNEEEMENDVEFLNKLKKLRSELN